MRDWVAIGFVGLVGVAGGFLLGRTTATRSLSSIAIPSGAVTEDVSSIEKLYHAGQMMDAALSTGVNRTRFHELLTEMTGEHAIAKSRAGGALAPIITSYEGALAILRDTSTVWQAETGESRLLTIPVGPSQLREVAVRYDLKNIAGEAIADPQYAQLLVQVSPQLMARASTALKAAARLFEARRSLAS